MAQKVKIGPSIALDGEKEFKQAITGINSEYRVMQSEMKLMKTSFDGNANSMEALTKKQSILNTQTEAQKKKIEVLKAALENSKKEFKENDTRTDRWKESLNNAESQLNVLNSELKNNEKYLEEAKNSTTKTATSIDEYGKQVKEAEEKTSTFGDVLKANLTSQVIIKAVKSIANGIKNVATSTVDLTKNAMESTDAIDKNSQKIGLSKKAYQEWDYVLSQNGVDIEGLQSGLKTLTTKTAAAEAGNKTAIASFQKLGISVSDLKGKSREDMFKTTVTALQNVADETEKAQIAVKLFGKSGQDLIPLLSQSAESTQGLIDKANNLGMVLSDDVIQKGVDATDAFDTFNRTTQSLKTEIGANLAPALTDSMQQISTVIAENKQELIGFAKDGIQLATDSLSWIITHKDELVTAITAIGTSFAIIKGGNEISNLKNKLKELGTASGGAKGAISGLVNVIKNNPIQAGALGATAIIGTMKLIEDASYNSKTELKKNLAEIERNTDELESYNNEIRNFIKGNDDSTTSLEVKRQSAETLITKIYELNDSQTKNSETTVEMNAAVKSLKELYPELNIEIDNNTGKVIQSKETLEQSIDALQKKAEAEAAYNMLVSTSQKKYEIEQKIAEQTEEATKAFNTYADAQKKVATMGNGFLKDAFNSTKNIVNGNAKAASKAGEDYQKLADELNKTKEESKKLDAQYDKYSQKCSTVEKANNDVANSTKSVSTQTISYGNKTKNVTADVAASWKKTNDAYVEAKKAAKESLDGQISLFQEWSGEATKSVDEMVQSFQNQADAENEWADNLKKASKNGIDKGLLESLAKMGPSSAGYLKELAGLSGKTDENVTKINKAWKNREKGETKMADSVAKATTEIDKTWDSLKTSATQKLGGLAIELETSGENAMSGLITGINSKTDAAIDTINDVATKMHRSFNFKLEINSPARTFKRSGGFIIDGLTNGVSEKSTDVENAMCDLAKTTYGTYNAEMEIHSPSQKLFKSGVNTVDGLINGVLSKKDAVKKTAKELASDLNSALSSKIEMKDLQEHGYSQYSIMGMWKGVVQATKLAGSEHVEAIKNYYSVRKQLRADAKSAEKDYKAQIKEAYTELKTNTAEAHSELKSKIAEINSAKADTINSLNQTLKDSIASSKESLMNGNDLFAKFTTNQSYTGKGLLNNLKTQVDGYTTYVKNMQTLRDRGVSGTLLADLEGRGVGAAGEISALSQMSQAELEEYKALYKSKEALSQSEANKQNEILKKQTEDSIKAANTAANKEIAAATYNTNKIIASYKKSAASQVKSINTAYKKEMYNLGITTKKQMQSIGLYTGRGMAEGLSKSSTEIYKSIGKIIGKTVKQTKDLLGIHSPSTVFQEIGDFSGQGLKVGFKNSIENMAQIVNDAIPTAIKIPDVQGTTAIQSAGFNLQGNENNGNVIVKLMLDSTQIAYATFSKISLLQNNTININGKGYAY